MMRKAAAIMFVATMFLAGDSRSEQRSGSYLLNMYHFNIQYVVGSEASMRRIVKQSFEPLVDFYLAHPGWGADFEMQGLMIEYMGQNYPEVLEKFKRLVNSGQAELVTFHYADQLLLAFPAHDQRWSIRLNDRLLEKYGIRRSGVIFTQEAQFGEGLAWLGKDHGYHVAVMTTGTYGWFQDDKSYPYFTANGMDVLVNRDAELAEAGIRVKWHFLGDGELVATGGFSPYFPGLFHENRARLKLLEGELKAAEQNGYKIATVTEYVEALREAGVEPAPLKPMLDSPWRPGDGSGVFQWMGKYVATWEKDYDMRTRNWQVRNLLVEAERAGASDQTLLDAWGHMVNAEVSDPTGWYPLPVEVNWDYAEMDALVEALENDPNLNVPELENKAAERPAASPLQEEPPFEVRTFGTAATAGVQWKELDEMPGTFEVSVSWEGKGDGGAAFSMAGDRIEYSPAMMEHMIREISLADIKGKTIHLGLPNGLIGLGDKNYLIRDNAAGTVAAGLYFSDREVVFEVKNGKEEKYDFRFYVLTCVSADQALEFANRINRIKP